MVVDTSALLAILLNEPERSDFNQKIGSANTCIISSGTYLETCIVIETRLGYEGMRDLRYFMETAKIEIIAFDSYHTEIARRAYNKFGKGKHPAGLNYGDCFAYALASTTDQPLLFKGNDFSQTDIKKA